MSIKTNFLSVISQFDSGKKLGLIAQNVETIIPEAVKDVVVPEENRTNGITTVKSVNYEMLIPVLVGAIQEQQKTIQAQQTEIDNMKTQLGLK